MDTTKSKENVFYFALIMKAIFGRETNTSRNTMLILIPAKFAFRTNYELETGGVKCCCYEV